MRLHNHNCHSGPTLPRARGKHMRWKVKLSGIDWRIEARTTACCPLPIADDHWGVLFCSGSEKPLLTPDEQVDSFPDKPRPLLRQRQIIAFRKQNDSHNRSSSLSPLKLHGSNLISSEMPGSLQSELESKTWDDGQRKATISGSFKAGSQTVMHASPAGVGGLAAGHTERREATVCVKNHTASRTYTSVKSELTQVKHRHTD